MQSNEKMLTPFLLGNDIPEAMEALGWQITEGNHVVSIKYQEAGQDDAKRIDVEVDLRITCHDWNPDVSCPRWHQTLDLRIKGPWLSLQQWFCILELGKMVSFKEALRVCNQKIKEEEHVCAA